MKYVKQFGIILLISFAGEALNYLLPLPVPASIYGLVLMFLCLQLRVFRLEDVRDTALFLIEIMPLMFIPAATGLMTSWGIIRAKLFAYLAIAVITTVLVMVVSGRVTVLPAPRPRQGGMSMEFFEHSVFFGVSLSLLAYGLGVVLQKRFRLALFNPLLLSVIVTILVLVTAHIDYEVYYAGAKYLSYLLTPATVCLAVPLYEKFALLRSSWRAILAGILSGVLTTLCSVLALSLAFRLSHEEYVTLLPKSITTAIGMGVSEELGGYVTLTVAMIIITGILGNVIAVAVCRVFRITEPIAKGVAIGSAAHALGTAKAIEIGEVEGAMSGLSIVVAGLLTVVGASVFANFL